MLLNFTYFLVIILGTFLVLLLFAFSICILLLLNQHWQYSHIPGPERTSFFCGNISELTDNKGRLLCEVLLDHALVYGPVFVWWYYYTPVVVISSPDFIKHGLVTLNLPKAPSTYNSVAYLFGRFRFTGSGLLTQLNDEKWKQQKHLISPAFHRGYLKDLITQFNLIANVLVTQLMKVADGKTIIDMANEFQKATLDVIGKVAFNMDLRCLEDYNTDVPNCLFKCLEGYQESYTDPFLCLPFYRHSFQKSVHESISFLRNLARECIQQRVEAIKNCRPLPNDILGMILQASQFDDSVSMEYLVDEFITFFIAGQDTTANQLSFALLETLFNEGIENRIFQEVDNVLGNKDTVEYDDIIKLQYLGQTLKESLRKHPPANGTIRTTTKTEKFGKFQIPKGTKVNFSIFVSHHLPENWQNPESFNPDRFSGNGNENKISNFVYFPFSCGPRICIGKVFSSINASILMARLFQKFKFELVAGQTLQRGEKLTICPKGGVLCTIKERCVKAKNSVDL